MDNQDVQKFFYSRLNQQSFRIMRIFLILHPISSHPKI